MAKKESDYITRFKSAVTGWFVTAAEAMLHPREHFKIKVKRKKKK